jgi:hypothetical protein
MDKAANAARMREYRASHPEYVAKQALREKSRVRNSPAYRAFQKKYREEHRGETAAYGALYRAKNKETANAYSKEYARQKRHFPRLYGITPADYRVMLEKQGCQCAICGAIGDNLHVDHCHKTKKVRGLLCKNCNTALGLFRDNKESIMSAITYLQAMSQ